MSMIIWKFPLAVKSIQEIELPAGAQILDAQVTPGKLLCLWALVDKTKPVESRTFAIYATGEQILSIHPLKHISTFQPEPGLVFHLFEITP